MASWIGIPTSDAMARTVGIQTRGLALGDHDSYNILLNQIGFYWTQSLLVGRGNHPQPLFN